MKKLFYIYKITNLINDKIYIGYTSQNPPEKRWKEHLYDSTSRYKQNNYTLYKAMNKYGKENFKFEIIYTSSNENHTLKEMEPFYIKKYNSISPFGYNMTKGGDKFFLSEESENKRLKNLRKVMKTKKYRNNVKEGQIKRYKDPEQKKLQLKIAIERNTPEYRENMSKSCSLYSYKIISPCNEIFYTHSINWFSKKYNISRSTLFNSKKLNKKVSGWQVFIIEKQNEN